MSNISHRLRLDTILSGASFLVLPIAVMAPKGLAPLIVLTILAFAIDRFRYGGLRIRPGYLVISLGSMVVISALSFFWSRTPGETITTSISLAAIFLGGAILLNSVKLLDSGQRNRVLSGLIYGGAVGYALLGLELYGDAIISRAVRSLYDPKTAAGANFILSFKPGNSVAAIYLWPWGGALLQRYSPTVAIPGIIIGLALVMFGIADAAKLSVVIGVAALILGYSIPRRGPLVLGLVLGVGFLAMPVIPGLLPNPLVTTKYIGFLPNSALHRIVIWQVTAKHIAERPVLGSGFDTSRSFYSSADGKLQYFAPGKSGKVWKNTFEPIPLHPHNGVLQIWLEMGFIGALLLVGVLIGVLQAISGLENRINRAACLGAMSSALVIGLVSFGAWQIWWLSALFLVGTAMVAVMSRPGPVPDKSG